MNGKFAGGGNASCHWDEAARLIDGEPRGRRTRRIAAKDGSVEPRLAQSNCSTQRFGHEADPEYGLLGLVQELHMPFGVWLQAARNSAKQVGANLGHLGPGGLAALEFRSMVGSPGIAAVANSEKIQRHFWTHVFGPPPQPVDRRQIGTEIATNT